MALVKAKKYTVDCLTGQVDREKEEFYLEQIRETQQQFEEIKARPVTRETPNINYNQVREFLKGVR